MKKALHIVLLLVLATACGPRIISRGDMTDIMRDILLQDQQIKQDYSLRRQADTSLVYEAVFEKYGYNMDSRNFLIADSEEAWILEALYGRRYIARRVPDDEVTVYPNCLIFNKPQAGDIVSKCFSQKGEDFDVIAAYQGPRSWKSEYNRYRWRELYRLAAGVVIDAKADYPFSIKPSHTITVEDIKRGLRSHYEGCEYEVKARHPTKGPGIVAPICRKTTVQSLVCELAPNVTNTVMHLTVGRPCEKPYGVYRPFAGQLPDDTVYGEEALARLKNYNLPLSSNR